MTAQIADRLVYEGKRFRLLANPLEGYFEKNPPRPNFVPKSTANWRGYMAGWEIRDGKLYFVSLSGTVCVKPPEEGGRVSSWCRGGHHGECVLQEIGLSDFFEDPNRIIFAEWFSGEVRVPHGEMVEYVHMGYGSKFERYLLIAIENGGVSGTRIVGADDYDKEVEARWAERKRAGKSWWWAWKSKRG